MDPLADPLGPRGRAFWDALHDDFEFDTHESQILLEACRVMDRIDELAEAINDAGVMILGSQGQSVLNGAVPELRQQQAALARLVTQLNLDAPDVSGALSAKEAAARAAAQKRWRDRKRDRSA